MTNNTSGTKENMTEEKISQVKFEERFLKSLLDKLKVGNRRGIHLNAIPGNARSRLDLKELEVINKTKSSNFLQILLSEDEFSHTIDFDGVNLTEIDEEEKNRLHLISRKLNNVAIDNEDQFLESGIKNFGFGYPLLIRRDKSDPSKIIKAPLLIWNLEIVRSNRKSNSWTISRTVDHPVRVNELLRSHILKDAQVNIDALDEDILKDNLINPSELSSICKSILSQLDVQLGEIEFEVKIDKCPTSAKIDSLTGDSAWIQWSGVFGIYTSRKESVIRRAEEILKDLELFQNKVLVLDKFQTSTVSAVSTDPSKEEIVNTLTKNEVKLIQGPPGTGKSQALTAIITNTIQNGGKCLVVCEKRTALNVIQHNLEKIGLSNLGIIIDDINKDRSNVVKKARSLVDNLNINNRYFSHSRQRSFESKYSEFTKLKENFNSKHFNERKSKINDEHWKDSIGRFIQFSNEIDWSEIKELMPDYPVSMTDLEYQELEESIQDASIAYANLDKDAYNLFSRLNKEIFTESYSRRKADEIKQKIFLCKKTMFDVYKITSNLSQRNVSYKDFSFFEIENLKNEWVDEKNRFELYSIYDQRITELLEGADNFTHESFTSNIITSDISKENVQMISIKMLDIEINKIKSITKKNIDIYKFILDIYSKFESCVSKNENILKQHNESKFKDLFINIFSIDKIKDSLKAEQKKNVLLEDFLGTLSEIESRKDKDELLKTTLIEKFKLLVQGEKSNWKKKSKIKKDILLNIDSIKEASTYNIFSDNEIQKISQEIKELLSVTNDNVEGYNKIYTLYQELDSLEKKYSKNSTEILTNFNIEISNFKNLTDYKSAVEKEKMFLDNLENTLDVYEQIHNWNHFYNSIGGKKKSIISRLKKNNLAETSWVNILRTWHYYNLLTRLEEVSSGFHKDNTDLEKLTLLYGELKKDQRELIKDEWAHNLSNKIPNNFKLLYNLRRNNVHNRTNSLRKIINDDFDLFTSIFPVILTNPLAADSMLPLELGIFDVVIFDEASQLRIEDTFTSFIRGKYKIIAGDAHQMPPSSYFQSSGDVVQDDDELSDEQLEETELALSESLLDFAEKLGFQSQSYLDYHYRSQHPALIDFSNVAFYGGNLVPFPEIFAYTPIKFYEVNGKYEERTNEDEVQKVIQILKNEIQPNLDGTFPSVGIATFNIPQRNRIIDELNELAIRDGEFSKKIEKIKESENGFFIKNLENIQGDEMDIVIISTTYGKDKEGKFFERFGPLNNEKGYKLLNVLITRAKDKVIVCTSIPSNKYLNYNLLLKQLGNNKKAIFYAYLAYANAISTQNLETANQIKEDLLESSHDQPRNTALREGLIESPFEQEVYDCLVDKFDSDKITPQKRIGGFRVDFLFEVGKEKIVIECDGKSYHSTNEAYAYDVFRQEELKKLGYKVYRIWSTNWWHDHNREIGKLVEYLKCLS